MIERRRSQRRQLELPLSLLGIAGRTMNISGTGVLIEVPSDSRVGSEIEFSLAIPTLRESGLRFRATVVRVDGGDQRALIAARLEDIEFEPAEREHLN